MAKQGNKALQVQILEEKNATEQTRESKGRLLPDISAGVVYSYYFDRQNIFLPDRLPEPIKRYRKLLLVAEMPLTDTYLYISPFSILPHTG